MNEPKKEMVMVVESTTDQQPQKGHAPGANMAHYLTLAIQRRWWLIVPLCLCLAAGIVYSVLVPKVYTAQTLILVEPQRVSQDYIKPLDVGKTEARVSSIQQQILSRTHLQNVIEKFKLFQSPEDRNLFMEEKVERLRRRITVEVAQKGGRNADAESITISFQGENPEKVALIANSIANDFIDENIKLREAQAVGTSDFLADELENKRLRLEAVEAKLKDFRKTHMGELPEQLESNLRILDRLQEQMISRQQILRDEKNRLAEIESQMGVAAAGTGDAALFPSKAEKAREIALQRKALNELLARYSLKHPDVVRLKSQIAKMEEEYAAMPDEPAGAVQANPALPLTATSNLAARRLSLVQSVKALNADINALQLQIKDYQTRVEDTPKREQELMSLQRGYDDMQKSYNSLLNRRLEAELASNLERKQKGEQFRIVDAARVPERPSKPDMKRVFMGFVSLGMAIGAGLIALQEYRAGSFSTPEQVENLVDFKVIATIPPIMNRRDLRRKRIDLVCTFAGLVLTFLLLGAFGIIAIKGVDKVDLLVRSLLA